MVIIVYADTVGKMCGLRQSHFFQFLIHHIHKCFLWTGHISCQRNRRICPWWQNGSIKQIPYRYLLIHFISGIAAVITITEICGINTDGNQLVQLLWLNIFRCYQHGKDFGHRCRNHTFQCIFSSQNRSGIHINENSLLADNGLRKRFCLCGLRSGIIKYFLCFRRYFRCLLLLRRLNHLWIFFVLSLFPQHNCQYQNNC